MCKVCDERKMEIAHDIEEGHKDLTKMVEDMSALVGVLSQTYVDGGRAAAAVKMGILSLDSIPRTSNDPDLLYELTRKSVHLINAADAMVRKLVDDSSLARDMGLRIKSLELMKHLMDQMPEHEHQPIAGQKPPTLH